MFVLRKLNITHERSAAQNAAQSSAVPKAVVRSSLASIEPCFVCSNAASNDSSPIPQRTVEVAVVVAVLVVELCGLKVGDTVGIAAGETVGAIVGLSVGETVGNRVGEMVGAEVGDTVGLAVGETVGERDVVELCEVDVVLVLEAHSCSSTASASASAAAVASAAELGSMRSWLALDDASSRSTASSGSAPPCTAQRTTVRERHSSWASSASSKLRAPSFVLCPSDSCVTKSGPALPSLINTTCTERFPPPTSDADSTSVRTSSSAT